MSDATIAQQTLSTIINKKNVLIYIKFSVAKNVKMPDNLFTKAEISSYSSKEKARTSTKEMQLAKSFSIKKRSSVLIFKK